MCLQVQKLGLSSEGKSFWKIQNQLNLTKRYVTADDPRGCRKLISM